MGVVGFSEPSALEGSRFAGWQIWCFGATERLPERQAAPEKSQRSTVIPDMWHGGGVDRPVEQRTT
jgi:hypothetical protein